MSDVRLLHPPPPVATGGGTHGVEPDLDAIYAYPAVTPWMRVNMIASVDGAAILDGGSRALGSSRDRELIGRLRGLADVVIVGAGTARGEDYGPLRPRAERRERRLAAGLAAAPRLAVVSGSLDLDFTAPAFTEPEPPTIVITHAGSPPHRRKEAAEASDLVVAGQRELDVAALIDALVARGLTRMLCEGGPTMLGSLAAAGRIDDLCLTVSPMLVAGDASRVSTGAPLTPPQSLDLVHVLTDEGFLFLHYARG